MAEGQRNVDPNQDKGAMSERTINQLCDIVRQTAYDIHVFHAHGHMEKVYENALAHRLRKLGILVQQQHAVPVMDEDGTVIGDYYVDLLVDGRLVVELKAVREILDEHTAQILGYLKASRIEHGLLINFGSFKFYIKKFVLTDRGRAGAIVEAATLVCLALGPLLCLR
jgi:GxxExxY protein